MDRLKQSLIFLFLSAILSSCATHVAKDGPPKFDVDVTNIPNATPKIEPLAKYGNMSSYVVFGKRYYTMASSRNYEAVGTASWYGTQFHQHKTSSGEPYDMLAMTAAHKTLPLPTYLEVTNLKNHRKIIVKVNDRGPFVSNRLIDLSYVAAKKLGVLGHGTAPVKIKAIDPNRFGYQIELAKNKPLIQHPLQHNTFVAQNNDRFARMQENISARGRMYLQVGAFKNKTRAIELRQRLVALLGTPIKIATPSKDDLYRVQVGPIKDLATEDRINNQLLNIGIKANKIGW